jgi:acyl dehydratase
MSTESSETRSAYPDLPEGKITDRALAELRAMVGVQLRPERFIREATIDTITNFCNGIGDVNPLHLSEDYAKWTRYGQIVAPFCFLYARTWPGRTRFGLPGVHGFHAGNDFTWSRRIRIGDQINAIDRVVGVEEKESRLSGRMVITTVETTFWNQDGAEVASGLGWNTRHERSATRERDKEGSSSARREFLLDPEELDSIETAQATEDETRRGDEPRYWEDVEVGDSIGPFYRGPLSLSDITAFLIGCGRGKAHGAAIKDARRHPGHYFRNPASGGAIEYTGSGHQQESVAEQVGAPGVYDFGPQRISWLGTMMEHWMGDDGFVKHLRGELRGFNVIGDITTLTAEVTEKYFDGAEPLVNVSISGKNQMGIETIPGAATVRLPTKYVGDLAG